MRRFLVSLGVTAAVMAIALSLVIAFGGPGTPRPMASVNDPFSSVDFSDLPALARFTARDGTSLAYRVYPPKSTTAAQGSVVLIHGSSASSTSLHLLAKAFAAAGYTTYVPDMRGHGASGEKGQIGYVGQLEDDLVDFTRSVAPPSPATLVGFSMGGGFAVRFAGSDQQTLFQSYLFISPFLSQDSPTSRPGDGGWTSVGVPRIVALSILDGFGIPIFDRLIVIRFALSDQAKASLTPEYSFALETNFRPQPDYMANLRAIHQPFAVMVGSDDEIFYADRFAAVLQQAGQDVPVTIVPGVDHIGMSLSPRAAAIAVQAVGKLRSAKR